MESLRIKNKSRKISWLMIYVIRGAVLSKLIHFLMVTINNHQSMYSRKTHLKGNLGRFPGCTPTNLAESKLCHQLNCLHGHQTHHYFFHLNLLVESYSTIVLISAFLLGNNII